MNLTAHQREKTREKLLADFPAFARRAWKEIESKPLEWGWHHQYLSEHLQLAYEREIRRLIIAVPPRSGKSRITTVLFPAWCWTRNPALNFLTTSYSDSLSEELSVLRRHLLQSKWFQETFPGRVLFASDQNRREQYSNQMHGTMIATSGTGTALGKGCDFLICDDALSPQQSYSDLERESVNRDFDSTFRSRLNDPDKGVIIIIAQRLHQKDLIGHVLETEPDTWVNLALPMQAEVDETIVFPLSGRILDRRAGDLLHPARFPQKWCEKQKSILGSYLWSSQYQQRPGILGGAVFKKAWFREYTNLPEKNIRVIMSLDTAYSIKKTADFSVASVWVAHEGKFYLVWIWRERCEYPRLKYMVQELYDTWNPDVVLIEDKGSGQSLLQSLRQETSLPVSGIVPVGDKISRAHSTTALFESGRVFFPKSETSWMPAFLHELELFPASAHDDQIDALTQALLYLRSQQSDGRLTFIEGMKAHAADWVRGIFTHKKSANGRKPATAAPSGSITVTLEGWKKWVERGQAPPCPHPNCKNPSTALMPDANGDLHIFCRQCARIDGQDLPGAEKLGHVHRWRVIPGGYERCDDCEEQRPMPGVAPMTTNGMTRAQYKGMRRRSYF